MSLNEMKVGDLVDLKYNQEGVGIIIRFDEEGDPVVLDTNGNVLAHLTFKVKVINENR